MEETIKEMMDAGWEPKLALPGTNCSECGRSIVHDESYLVVVTPQKDVVITICMACTFIPKRLDK